MSSDFNVDQTRIYPWHGRQRQLPIWQHTGRPPGHVVSRAELINKLNDAVRQRESPAYKWWAASVLGVSEPTLRAMLRDYELDWPPPWTPAA